MPKRHLILALILTLLILGASFGQVISSIQTVNSTAMPTIQTIYEGINVYQEGGLGDRLVNVPCEFVDNPTQIIVSLNEERTNLDYQLDVTLQRLGILYILLDDRHDQSQPLNWMLDTDLTGLPAPFFDAGISVEIDADSSLETAGDSVDATFSVWATIAPTGTYSLYAQDFGDDAFHYLVLANRPTSGPVCVPEPSSHWPMLATFLIILLNRQRKLRTSRPMPKLVC